MPGPGDTKVDSGSKGVVIQPAASQKPIQKQEKPPLKEGTRDGYILKLRAFRLAEKEEFRGKGAVAQFARLIGRLIERAAQQETGGLDQNMEVKSEALKKGEVAQGKSSPSVKEERPSGPKRGEMSDTMLSGSRDTESARGTALQQMLPGSRQVARALELFEKIFLKWFTEGGKKGEFQLPKGEAQFAKKSEKEAVDLLYRKGLPFTVERKMPMSQVEGLRFRTLVRNPPEVGLRNSTQGSAQEGAQKAVVVSDLILANGKMEKFARIPLAILSNPAVAARVLAHLESMLPGEKINKALLMEWFGAGGDLSFLALSHKVVRPELAKAFKSALTEAAEGRSEEAVMAYGREASQGIALSARTEEMVARQLDINLRSTNPSAIGEGENQNISGVAGGTGPAELSHKTLLGLRKRRRRGMGVDEGEILIPGFVPWYELVFKPYKWKGKPRWWVPLLYLIAASTVGLGSVYVFKFLLLQR